MREREAELRAFHERRPGITARGWGRGGTYERLAACAAPGERVLDLGCADAHLLELLVARGVSGIGLDLAPYPNEGNRSIPVGSEATTGITSARVSAPTPAERILVQGRAQALPFSDGAFDLVVCHLAFMLFDELDLVAREIDRVSSRFAAILGGGPIANDDPPDAFHTFLRLAAPRATGYGDHRARTPDGWCALFPDWQAPRFERIEVDLSGSFDDVYAFLSSNYGVERDVRDALRAEFPGALVPCRAAVSLATITR